MLDEYTYVDGRKVSFDRTKVVHLEPHVSGIGSLIRLQVVDSSAEMHLAEEYAFLRDRISESWIERGFREMHEKKELQGASEELLNDIEVPF